MFCPRPWSLQRLKCWIFWCEPAMDIDISRKAKSHLQQSSAVVHVKEEMKVLLWLLSQECGERIQYTQKHQPCSIPWVSWVTNPSNHIHLCLHHICDILCVWLDLASRPNCRLMTLASSNMFQPCDRSSARWMYIGCWMLICYTWDQFHAATRTSAFGVVAQSWSRDCWIWIWAVMSCNNSLRYHFITFVHTFNLCRSISRIGYIYIYIWTSPNS